MSDDEDVLACWKVADLESPRRASVRGQYCRTCRAELWVMARNLSLGMPLLCRDCARERAIRVREFVVLPASEAHKRRGR